MPKPSRKGGGRGLSRTFSSMAALPGDLSHGDKSFDLDGEPMHSDPRAAPSTATSGSNVSWSFSGK